MPCSLLVPVELTDDERVQLEVWTRRRTSAQALALQSRIVLLAAEGLNNTQIAGRLGVHRNVAGKWRSRFGLDGLTDEPRTGRPRAVTDAQVEEVIVKTLETTPTDATHWSTRSMAKEVGLTQSAVQRIWNGRRSGCSPTARRPGSSPRTRSSSTRSATSSGCVSTRPSAPSYFASMRSLRYRRWTGPRRAQKSP
jgi:transposase